MFIDASALTAIIAGESDAEQLLLRLDAASLRYTSAPALWETVVAVSRILDMPIAVIEQEVDAYLLLADIELLPVGLETGRIAVRAFDRFGKGRHPAALNFGDCFSYACAREHGLPLLYKGDDFIQTDIDAA